MQWSSFCFFLHFSISVFKANSASVLFFLQLFLSFIFFAALFCLSVYLFYAALFVFLCIFPSAFLKQTVHLFFFLGINPNCCSHIFTLSLGLFSIILALFSSSGSSALSIYIKLIVCLSVCLSAIEIKLETFRYKQTYESYITFSREAKYGILISIRIVYGGLRAYIYSTYINSFAPVRHFYKPQTEC